MKETKKDIVIMQFNLLEYSFFERLKLAVVLLFKGFCRFQAKGDAIVFQVMEKPPKHVNCRCRKEKMK